MATKTPIEHDGDTLGIGSVEEPIVIHPATLDGAETTELTVDLEARVPAGGTPTAAGAVSTPAAEPHAGAVPPPAGERPRERRGAHRTPRARPPLSADPRPVLVDVPAPELPPAAEPMTRRAVSLDALRGLFLLVMTLGFTIQSEIFPAWMYHRQNPPPLHDYLAIAGLTWRDLAYPAFLFTMAAAFPITLTLRIDRGVPGPGIVHGALKRALLLFLFALLIGHSNAYFIGEYSQTSRLLGIAGFAVLFLVFTRKRSDWGERGFGAVRKLGWVAAAAFLALTPLLYEASFSLARRDEIIAELAFSALVGSLVWYFTRTNLQARLAVLAFVVALHLGAQGDGWIAGFWWNSPAPWLFQYSYLSLLAVLIPGTIAGDLLLRWMKTPREADTPARWSRVQLQLLALAGVAATPILVIGLYNRWVAATVQAAGILCALTLVLTHRPGSAGERMVRGLFLWGAFWLMLGLVMEPFEGGIKKAPATLAYFFSMAGNTFLLLGSMTAVMDLLGGKRRLQALVDVGQNPMIAYVVFSLFLNSALELVPALRPVLRGSPGESLLRSLLSVLLVVLIVRAFSRRRVFWRT